MLSLQQMATAVSIGSSCFVIHTLGNSNPFQPLECAAAQAPITIQTV